MGREKQEDREAQGGRRQAGPLRPPAPSLHSPRRSQTQGGRLRLRGGAGLPRRARRGGHAVGVGRKKRRRRPSLCLHRAGPRAWWVTRITARPCARSGSLLHFTVKQSPSPRCTSSGVPWLCAPPMAADGSRQHSDQRRAGRGWAALWNVGGRTVPLKHSLNSEHASPAPDLRKAVAVACGSCGSRQILLQWRAGKALLSHIRSSR